MKRKMKLCHIMTGSGAYVTVLTPITYVLMSNFHYGHGFETLSEGFSF